jgi:hypothetical protein
VQAGNARIGIVAIASPLTASIRVAIAVHISRFALTVEFFLEAAVNGASGAIGTGYGRPRNTPQHHAALFHSVTKDLIGALCVVRNETAAPQLFVTAVKRAVQIVITLGTIDAGSP